MSFWEASFLWREAVIASVFLAMACGVTGVYSIMGRAVFLPATLSQFSGFGVMLAFAATSIHSATHVSVFLVPEAAGITFALVGALWLGWWKEPLRMTRETLIGITYIVASAGIILIADTLPQEQHHVEDLLFGNAVMVEVSQMWVAVVVSIFVLIVHALRTHVFLFVSFDPETASAHGLRVPFHSAALFCIMGLTIAVTTKTIGALPAFAFSVLPGVAAMALFGRTYSVFIASGIIAALCAFLGYWISFVWDLPTGACTTALVAMVAGLSTTLRRIIGKRD